MYMRLSCFLCRIGKEPLFYHKIYFVVFCCYYGEEGGVKGFCALWREINIIIILVVPAG